MPPFFVGPDPNDANTQIFRIAANQPFGVIYGSHWIRTTQQLQQTINAGMLSGTTSDYVRNEEGYYVAKSAYHTIDEVPLKAFVCEQFSGNTCTSAQSVVQIGDVNPDFNMGFSSTLQWHSISLSGTLNWVKGGQIYNYTRQWPFNEQRDMVFDQSNKPAVTCPATWQTTAPTCPYSTGKKPIVVLQHVLQQLRPERLLRRERNVSPSPRARAQLDAAAALDERGCRSISARRVSASWAAICGRTRSTAATTRMSPAQAAATRSPIASTTSRIRRTARTPPCSSLATNHHVLENDIHENLEHSPLRHAVRGSCLDEL